MGMRASKKPKASPALIRVAVESWLRPMPDCGGKVAEPQRQRDQEQGSQIHGLATLCSGLWEPQGRSQVRRRCSDAVRRQTGALLSIRAATDAVGGLSLGGFPERRGAPTP
jgi:hypothetical protein